EAISFMSINDAEVIDAILKDMKRLNCLSDSINYKQMTMADIIVALMDYTNKVNNREIYIFPIDLPNWWLSSRKERETPCYSEEDCNNKKPKPDCLWNFLSKRCRNESVVRMVMKDMILCNLVKPEEFTKLSSDRIVFLVNEYEKIKNGGKRVFE
ncbi:hypothetical protein K8R66_04840, partial [bacterium]|nr:hypothetical protein [bacterium]